MKRADPLVVVSVPFFKSIRNIEDIGSLFIVCDEASAPKAQAINSIGSTTVFHKKYCTFIGQQPKHGSTSFASYLAYKKVDCVFVGVLNVIPGGVPGICGGEHQGTYSGKNKS